MGYFQFFYLIHICRKGIKESIFPGLKELAEHSKIIKIIYYFI